MKPKLPDISRVFKLTRRAILAGGLAAAMSPAAYAMLFSGAPSGGGGALNATLNLRSISGSNIAANQPFQFGLPIAPATMSPGQKLVLTDAASNSLTVQEDNHVIDADGYIRWIMVTTIGQTAPGAANTNIAITATSGSPNTSNPITLANLLAQTISADTFQFKRTITMPNGDVYVANATDGLNASATWSYGSAFYEGITEQGPLKTTFVVYAPFVKTGTPHPYLYCEFHIHAYKSSGAAWNNATNPITGVKVYAFNENGFNGVAAGWAGSPQDYVYDLVDKVGASTLATVLTLDGGSTTGNLTLAATSGNALQADRAAGSFVTSTSAPNSSHSGKAIVELSGSATGRAYIAEYSSASRVYTAIPSTTPFTGTTVTSWKIMGVYHYFGSRVSNTNPAIKGGWWGTNHDLVYPVLSTAYLKASQMVPNYRFTSSNTQAPNLTLCDRDGAHPCGMSINSGYMKNYGNNEAATGDADHIGVLTYTQVNSLIWWDDATQHANARKNLIYNAEVGHRKPYVYRNEEYGQFNTLSDAGVYGADAGTDAAIILNLSRAGSNWFNFAGNHSGQVSYVPYLLTGDLYHLQNQFLLSTMYSLQSSGYGVFDTGTVANGVTCSGTTITGTHSSLPFQTGESFQFAGGRPSIGGIQIPASNRYFWRILTSNTGQAYDTKANALAGTSTGRVTFSTGGSGVYLVNGFFKQGCSHAGEPQARTIAWNFRTIGQPIALCPDNPITVGACITSDWTKANVRRPLAGLLSWAANLYVNNVNYLAGFKPRYYTISNGSSGGQWQINYNRQSDLQLLEAGVQSPASSALASQLDWSLADAIQWHVETTIWPPAYCSSYYFIIATDFNTGVTTTARDFVDCYNNSISTPWNGGAYSYADPTNITASIVSIADLANVIVTLSAPYFDTGNKTPYEGKAWFGTTSAGSLTGYGKIKTITSSTVIVVDFTATTSTFGTVSPISPTTGSGKGIRVPIPPPAVATANAATADYYYNGNNAYRTINADYANLDRASLEIAKQRSINQANYPAAVAEMTGRSFAFTPANANGAEVKFGLVSRV